MGVINSVAIKLKSKYIFLSGRNYKKTLLNALPFWLGSFITGIVSVLYAKLFSWAEQGTMYFYRQASWSLFIITPLSFLIGWWLVKRIAPFARGSGIPQVSAAIELSNPKYNYKVNKLLGLRVIFVKVLSSLAMIFGGGIIGREGPTIQISASIFKKINDLLPKWYPKISKRNMIVTGAAAGLASAFNTPLGGIVFAIEELTKTHFNFFKSALLTGVIIAGLTALNFLGPYLYLGYPTLNNIPFQIIFTIIPVAIITGICGSGIGYCILMILRRKNLFEHSYKKALYAVFAGLVIASLAVLIDNKVLGSGKEIMITSLFTDNKHVDWYIPIVRIIGSIISFSVGASGGIFAPSLSLGASIGAVVSGWLHLTGSETNLIILCGMVGALTGITRSPFTSSILVIEMTNSHNIIFYLMMSGLLSNIIAGLVSKHSFYDYLKDQYIHEIHKTEIQEQVEDEEQADAT